MSTGRSDVSDATQSQQDSSDKSEMSMMRIAVAGTGGLARLVAYYIDEDTSHQVVFLSRSAQPQLTSLGYQVSVIDYTDADSLTFALRGIDTVISTVTGPNQVELIRAAVSARVRRFAPAEFEGPPHLRPQNDPLDRDRAIARQWLAYHSRHIESTIFICGIFYERFQPGGLRESSMGTTSGFSDEGSYIMDCRSMAAQVPSHADDGTNATICLTAAQDVARFVTRALDLRQWPAELRMYGQRVSVMELVATVQRLRGREFRPIQYHNPGSLRSELQLANAQQDYANITRLQTHIATAEGRYDFQQPNLNQMFPDLRPISFQDFFIAKWTGQQ